MATAPDTAPDGRAVAIRVLFVAFAAWLLTNIDQSLFAYAVPQIRQAFNVDLAGIGTIISLSFIAGMFIPIGVGMLTDRYGARRTLPLCLCLSALLVGVQGLLVDVTAFTGARVASFGLSAALSPITSAIVLSAAPVRWRAMMVAILQCAYPLGWLISSLIVAPLIEQLGWRPLFYVGFIIAPMGLLLAALLPRGLFGPQPPRPAGEARPSLPVAVLFDPAHRRTTLLCAAAFFFNSGAVAATAFYLPTFLNEVRGYGLGDSALIVGIGYGVGVIGYIGSALVSTWWLTRRDTIVLWNLVAAALFLVTIWLPTRFSEDIIAFGLLSIFYYGTAAILITFVLESFPEHLRATAAAVCGTACVSASMASFPLLVAHLVPMLGWTMTFSLIVVPSLLLSALAIAGLPRGFDPRRNRLLNHGEQDAPRAQA
ncbi:MFS transporter [Polymorphobacter sp.]|uniref:MFS transporter n=1 Tax=Polymorphobacter sp. TaxID=1909290 RepID=UPI003F720D02